MERHCCPASGVGDVVSPIPEIFPTLDSWGERYGGEVEREGSGGREGISPGLVRHGGC